MPLLFAHFLARASGDRQCTPPPMSTAVRRTLMEHDWPGNVRELAHFADQVALDIDAPTAIGSTEEPCGGLVDRLERFEKAVLEEALHRHAGDIVAITDALRLPRKTLYDKLRRHGLRPGDFRAGDAGPGTKISRSWLQPQALN